MANHLPIYAASLAEDGHVDAVGHDDRQKPNTGQWTVAVVGTPFYLPFKTAACGVSLVVVAAVSALAGRSYDALGDGITANCGPPYVLSPSSLEAAGFHLVVTSLDAEVYDADAVLSLYRTRWLIELAVQAFEIPDPYRPPAGERPETGQGLAL